MALSHADGYQTLPVHFWAADKGKNGDDNIAQEQAIALVYNGISHAVMMATPLDLEDFARGFSLSEGIIHKLSELQDIEIQIFPNGIELQISINSERMMALKQHRRSLTGRTGCGLCGAESLSQAIRPVHPVTPRALPNAQAVQYALSQLNDCQPLQSLTGALHGAAWCNAQGEICHIREDVGRHNALDKLIGLLQLQQQDLTDGFVLVSSRASYEMIQKACSINVPTLVAVSAPTTLAIQLATEAQLNLIGFARKGYHVIYTQQEKDFLCISHSSII